IIYSIVHVEEVQPPLLTVTFINASAPPPPPPPPPKGSSKPKTPKIPKPVVQPTTTPTQIVQPKEKEEPEEKAGESGGVEGGVEGGVAGGVVGGVVGGTVGAPPAPQKPVNKPAFLILKQKIGGVDPRLPDVVKLQNKGQVVRGTYKICIDSSGSVNQVS